MIMQAKSQTFPVSLHDSVTSSIHDINVIRIHREEECYFGVSQFVASIPVSSCQYLYVS